jgi:hypothetical protein
VKLVEVVLLFQYAVILVSVGLLCVFSVKIIKERREKIEKTENQAMKNGTVVKLSLSFILVSVLSVCLYVKEGLHPDAGQSFPLIVFHVFMIGFLSFSFYLSDH